jgi:hypothetical protein
MLFRTAASKRPGTLSMGLMRPESYFQRAYECLGAPGARKIKRIAEGGFRDAVAEPRTGAGPRQPLDNLLTACG